MSVFGLDLIENYVFRQFAHTGDERKQCLMADPETSGKLKAS